MPTNPVDQGKTAVKTDMCQVVHKYPLDEARWFQDLIIFEWPEGAEILVCLTPKPGDVPVVYVRHDREGPLEKRFLAVVGTGEPLREDAGRYLGTYVLRGTSLVSHVFEVTGVDL